MHSVACSVPMLYNEASKRKCYDLLQSPHLLGGVITGLDSMFLLLELSSKLFQSQLYSIESHKWESVDRPAPLSQIAARVAPLISGDRSCPVTGIISPGCLLWQESVIGPAWGARETGEERLTWGGCRGGLSPCLHLRSDVIWTQALGENRNILKISDPFFFFWDEKKTFR